MNKPLLVSDVRRLSPQHKTKTLVAGFGSALGADALGWNIIDLLDARLDDPCIVLRKYRHPSAVVGDLSSFDSVWLVDALQSNSDPYGSLLEFPARGLSPSQGLFSSHAKGLNDAVLLADTLGVLPQHAQILGVNVLGKEDCPLNDQLLEPLLQRLVQALS